MDVLEAPGMSNQSRAAEARFMLAASRAGVAAMNMDPDELSAECAPNG